MMWDTSWQLCPCGSSAPTAAFWEGSESKGKTGGGWRTVPSAVFWDHVWSITSSLLFNGVLRFFFLAVCSWWTHRGNRGLASIGGQKTTVYEYRVSLYLTMAPLTTDWCERATCVQQKLDGERWFFISFWASNVWADPVSWYGTEAEAPGQLHNHKNKHPVHLQPSCFPTPTAILWPHWL